MSTKKLLSVFILCLVAQAQDAARPSGWVVLPVSEYSALRGKAFPVDGDPAPPPVEATLTRVEYTLRVDGDLATGQASLTVDVLKDGWVRVPIPQGLLVREARLEGRPVPLVRGDGGKGGGQQAVLLNKRGRAAIALDLVFRVASSAGEERIALPSSVSGITRAAVTLPRQDIQISVSGGILSENGAGKCVAYGRGSEPLQFSWRRKMENHRATEPLRQRGALTELLGLGEDSTSINTEVSLEVLQGAAKQVRIQLPAQIAINQVQGPLVSDWEVKSGELVVAFLEPVEQHAGFIITGEVRLPREGAIEVPLLRLLDVERETGGVAVEVLGAGEINDTKAQALDRTDASDLGATVAARQSPSLAAFRFRANAQQARALTVQVTRYEQEAVLTALIEEARYRVLMSKEGKTLVQARYAVRNNQRNFVKIALPPGAVVWSSSLAGSPARPGQSPDGALLFPLLKARAGQDAPLFAIEILYLTRAPAWEDKGRVTLSLPAIDVRAQRTGLTLFYPPAFRVTAEPGAFRLAEYTEPASTALASVPVGDDKEKAVVAGPGYGGGIGSGRGQGVGGYMQLTPGVAQNALVQGYRAKSESRKTPALLPVRVSFPAVGPSLFLVAELGDESKGPTVDITYQKEKGGAR